MKNVAMILLLLNMLIIAITAELKVDQRSKWLAFQSTFFKYDQRWQEVPYWSAIFCRSMGGPATVFLEVYLIANRSQTTQDFFNLFTRYLYDTQLKCVNAISSSSYHVEYLPITDVNWSWRKKLDDCFTSNSSMLTQIYNVQPFFFNNPTVARVITTTFQSVDLLAKYEFGHWNHKQYVVVLIIFEDSDKIRNLCAENINEVAVDIAMDILMTLWKKYGVYNLFIGFPLLAVHNKKLWSYDPFHRDKASQHSGRIVEIDPMTSACPKRLRNLQGYKLDIGLFEGKLTAGIRSVKTKLKKHHPVISDFYGVDGYLVQTMSKHFNLTMDIIPPSGGIKYGHVLENGTAIGTLGDVAYRRIHASFNSQYVKEYITTNEQRESLLDIEFTVPVDWDRVCIIVPASQEIPRWLRTFIYLHPAIWVCLLVAIIVATAVWHLFRNQHHIAPKNYSSCQKNYLVIFIDTLLLVVGAPFRPTNILGERILIGALALLGITIMGAFTGTLYHSFTNEMFYHSIETLEELDASGLLIGTSSPNLNDIFGPKNYSDESSTLSRLANKIRSWVNDDVSTIAKTAYGRNIAAIYREKVFFIEQHHYVNANGKSLVHLVSDCPQAYYLAYLLPANSIFLQSFNSIITALREAGIIVFWNENTLYRLINNEIKSAVIEKDRILDDPKPFSIHDMQTSFFILACGLAISVIMFSIEWLNYRWLKCIIMSRN